MSLQPASATEQLPVESGVQASPGAGGGSSHGTEPRRDLPTSPLRNYLGDLPSGSSSRANPSCCSAVLKACWRLKAALDLVSFLKSMMSGLETNHKSV